MPSFIDNARTFATDRAVPRHSRGSAKRRWIHVRGGHHLGVKDIVICGHSHCGAVGAGPRRRPVGRLAGHAAVRPSGAQDDPEVDRVRS